MGLVWKLLRQHISIPQFAGFVLANLFGMLIVLLGYQFYNDVLPVFTQQDSFMKSDYLIVSKKISMATTVSGNANTFSSSEIEDLRRQPFAARVGRFSSVEYKVEAQMGIEGQTILNSEIFLESVPDEFIDVPLKDWAYTAGNDVVPVILPRSYINMYNFGFAQSHSLPKISDGLVSMIDFRIFAHSGVGVKEFKGKVIGFSNRLNTILVPQAFMEWSNGVLADGRESAPNRLLLEVGNPADENVTAYLDQHGYEVETDRLDAEKTTYFLRMVVTIVMLIGAVISVLSFYILMLSVYLLVQKNTEKLENLLLIGYSPARVAMPYQLLTVGLNAVVLVVSLGLLYLVRGYYMSFIYQLYPELSETSLMPAAVLGVAIWAFVSSLNYIVIRRKITLIWKRK
ncbi:MAG: ABC transporter permease [Prevotella sp.]|nr:ABC transporter permease [Prevotella sp.]